MANRNDDRSERLSQLQALAADTDRALPQLDPVAFETALAELAAHERRSARFGALAKGVLAVLVLAVLALIGVKLA